MNRFRIANGTYFLPEVALLAHARSSQPGGPSSAPPRSPESLRRHRRNMPAHVQIPRHRRHHLIPLKRQPHRLSFEFLAQLPSYRSSWTRFPHSQGLADSSQSPG